ncbi:MAG: hypothetical protein QXP98_08415 [Thermoproteus sp.]
MRIVMAAGDVELVLIDGRLTHELVMGAPLATRGLVGFNDLKFPSPTSRPLGSWRGTWPA